MANPSSLTTTTFLLLLLLLLTTTTATATTSTTSSTQEFETMLTTLRSHGYTLFSNAITTSDLQYTLLSAAAAANSTTFTVFAPVDELLFALDMSADADAYVTTLKYHVIPGRRHSSADLRNLSTPFLQTLLPHYSVLIGKTQDAGYPPSDNATPVGLMVDGVRLSDPDIFLGSGLAVHGIDGILLTGLNMNHEFGLSDVNGSDPFAPAAESPAEVNIPVEGISLPPVAHLDNASIAPAVGISPPMAHLDKENASIAPASTFDRKIPAESPEMLPEGKKKMKRRRRRGGGRRRRGRGLRRHRLDDLLIDC